MNSEYPFYTIGHATRQIGEFVGLLKGQDISVLVDVRSVPRSRANPEYNEDNLSVRLEMYGIHYIRIPELGGFRAKSKTIPFETNAFWQHNSFHNYADYAMSGGFQDGLDKLLALGREQPAAIMCAETVWWKCHRRIITDYLLMNGEKVFHIIGENNVKAARLTDNARISEGILSYPQE